MATKKQKREAAEAKHAAFVEQERLAGLAALETAREKVRQENLAISQRAAEINARRQIVEEGIAKMGEDNPSVVEFRKQLASYDSGSEMTIGQFRDRLDDFNRGLFAVKKDEPPIKKRTPAEIMRGIHEASKILPEPYKPDLEAEDRAFLEFSDQQSEEYRKGFKSVYQNPNSPDLGPVDLFMIEGRAREINHAHLREVSLVAPEKSLFGTAKIVPLKYGIDGPVIGVAEVRISTEDGNVVMEGRVNDDSPFAKVFQGEFSTFSDISVDAVTDREGMVFRKPIVDGVIRDEFVHRGNVIDSEMNRKFLSGEWDN